MEISYILIKTVVLLMMWWL